MIYFILILLIIFTLFVVFLSVAIEGKLDWTKEHKLLFWYTEYEKNGMGVRKYIKLFEIKK